MKVCLVGVAGAVGSAFALAFQRGGHEVFGIDQREKIQKIKEGRFFIETKPEERKILNLKVFSTKEKGFWDEMKDCDILFFAVPRPLKDCLSFYFQKIKEKKLKIPLLFFIQNGWGIRKEVSEIFQSFFNPDEEKIERLILLNPISKKEEKEIVVTFSFPLRILVPSEKERDFFYSFGKNFSFYFFPKKEEENLEYSKLFLNLFGMASAANGFSLKEGLFQKEILRKEIGVLKEYIFIVKKRKGKIFNLPGYPLKIFSFFISFFPLNFFYFLRKIILFFVSTKRERKEKSLKEIDFYNGQAVFWAKEMGLKLPFNEEVWKKGKSILLKTLK
ncbi:MAG: ketopantoate reductase family protein [Minisyncoccales bacterium]